MKNKFWFSPYEIQPHTAFNRLSIKPQKGFLIRWQSDDFEEGYADCHPWSLFADDPVEIQLKKWRQGQPSPLLQQSLYWAHIDGVARSMKKSLFTEIKVKSHYTCVNLSELTPDFVEVLGARGFTTIKLKINDSLIHDLAPLQKISPLLSRFGLRLDFNGSGYEVFMSQLQTLNLTLNIHGVEDPASYDLQEWQRLESTFKLPIYYDQPPGVTGETDVPFSRVIKPARECLEFKDKDIVTNSMDHPIGQSFAYFFAQQILENRPQVLDFGLQTSHLVQSQRFFQEIETSDCYFKPSWGWGVGFNDLLRKQEWIPL